MIQISGVFFDFDGTLLDSASINYKATCEIFRQYCVPVPPFEDYLVNFEYPLENFFSARGIRLSDSQIRDHFIAHLDFRQATLFSDTIHTLEILAARKMTMGIVSCQTTHIVDWHCQTKNIGRFFHPIFTGCDSKVDSIIAARDFHHIVPGGAMYVGDFVSDIRDAKAGGALAVGVTRGIKGVRAKLMAAGADHCIDHLRELPRLIWENEYV